MTKNHEFRFEGINVQKPFAILIDIVKVRFEFICQIDIIESLKNKIERDIKNGKRHN